MAARWSSEHVVAEYKDVQANTMAIDCTGQYAVLAGRRYITIVNLVSPSSPVNKLLRQSKYEVGAAQWSPHLPQYFAIACNQRAEIYDWRGDLSLVVTLKQHTRHISDLDWAVFDQYMLATASIDTYVHLWDTRDARRPVSSLSAVAGATQVRWNKCMPNLLATSHEGDIRLWDPRKSVSPVNYIGAHLTKIHGIDWSPINEHQLATSSQDCSVKFWDVRNVKKCEHTLTSRFPVWRARYTPFGDGLVTVVVPQLRRGENSLVLWNVSNLETSVHTFLGHTDVVLEFGWMKPRDESKDCYLITWSKDQSLRIWTIDYQLQKLCGYREPARDDFEALDIVNNPESNDNGSVHSSNSQRDNDSESLSALSKLNETSLLTNQDETLPAPNTPSPIQPYNLSQEFSLVNINIPKVEVEEMDANKRSCTVLAICGIEKVHLIMNFPSAYPYNSPPTFHYGRKTTVEKPVKSKITVALKATAHNQVKRNRSCLEPCLRQLISTLETFNFEDKEVITPENSYMRMDTSITPQYISAPVYGSFQDSSVPFPRTSGARFCGADFLICFVRPAHLQKINAPTEVTPRSLSALGGYLSTHLLPVQARPQAAPSQFYPPTSHSPTAGDSSVSISSFYFQDRKQRLRGRIHKANVEKKPLAQKTPSVSGAVVIYSIEGVIPISRTLAENYVFLDKNVPAMCSTNASVAGACGRMDLVQVWNLASLMSSPGLLNNRDSEFETPWAQHPFGCKTLESLIDHYIQHWDVQTVAMLLCAFGSQIDESPRVRKITMDYSPGGSPYHTVVPADTQVWTLAVSPLRRNRSNSWSDCGEEFRISDYFHDSKEPDKEDDEANYKMLDPKKCLFYDQFKKVYAEILYRWSLYEQRAQVLKYVSSVEEKHKGIEFLNECYHCQKEIRGPQCTYCKNYSLQCSVCHVAVKGASNFCLACGHGGHTLHMLEWFVNMDTCPSGCGCNCLDRSNSVFGP